MGRLIGDREVRRHGIDEKAVPKVGQGITTFSQFDMPGWSAKPGHASDTWNFHYATNILASGKDYITLENASTWWHVEVKSGPHSGKIGWIMSNYFEIA